MNENEEKKKPRSAVEINLFKGIAQSIGEMYAPDYEAVKKLFEQCGYTLLKLPKHESQTGNS